MLSKELSKNEESLRQKTEKIGVLLEELTDKNKSLEELVEERTASLISANEDLQKSNNQLKRFAYAASHDLQEPLRMIGSFVQLLDKRYGDKIGQDGKDFNWIRAGRFN